MIIYKFPSNRFTRDMFVDHEGWHKLRESNKFIEGCPMGVVSDLSQIGIFITKNSKLRRVFLKTPIFDENGVFTRRPKEDKNVFNWFHNQLFFPDHEFSDDKGYLHFKSKKCLNEFKGKNLKG